MENLIAELKIIDTRDDSTSVMEKIGWNNAIISLLKHSYTQSDSDLKIKTFIREKLGTYASGVNFDINKLHDKFLSHYQNGAKLQAIKDIKDIAGISLKEAKEFIDDLFTKFSFLS